MSFGFERQSDEKHPERRGITRITKAKMREVSPVTFPSIPGALASRAKSRDGQGRQLGMGKAP